MTTSEPAGVVVLDKPEGLTSHDVVARMRRALGIRRVGHAGTLDPFATGVLVLGFGAGTRLLPYLQATDKEYAATIRLGWPTTTDDRSGTPLRDPVAVTIGPEQVDDALRTLTGTIQQRPSAVSAIKVDGRRSYKRVRAGEDVELQARSVTVGRLERVGDIRFRADGSADLDVLVECSTGTYVRALARDAGATLGCGGHLSQLRRTRVGPFGLDLAAEVPDRGGQVPPMLPLGQVAASVLPTIVMGADDAFRTRHGQRLPVTGDGGDGPTAILDVHGGLVAVAQPREGHWRLLVVFAES